MAFRWGENDAFPRFRNATEGVPYSYNALGKLYFARTRTSYSHLDERPFRCVPAPVSPGGHAGLTRLRAGVAAGANMARFSPCKVYFLLAAQVLRPKTCNEYDSGSAGVFLRAWHFPAVSAMAERGDREEHRQQQSHQGDKKAPAEAGRTEGEADFVLAAGNDATEKIAVDPQHAIEPAVDRDLPAGMITFGDHQQP